MASRVATEQCLSENDVLAFVNGQLSFARCASVEHHVDACESCRDLVYLALEDGEAEESPAGAGEIFAWGGEQAAASASAAPLSAESQAQRAEGRRSESDDRITLPPLRVRRAATPPPLGGARWSRWWALAVLASLGGLLCVLARAYWAGSFWG